MIGKVKKYCLIFIGFLPVLLMGQSILIPMDLTQTDHLRAYGIAYWALEQGINVEWLLNYKGGSFLLTFEDSAARQCLIRGVSYTRLSGSEIVQVYKEIEEQNMDVILLEKAPKIAVYTPPNKQPWDDAVTLALTYSQISYDTVFDEEVLQDKLSKYDWLHLHHEDFTGQYGKFYANYRNASWYVEQKRLYESEARRLGYPKVSRLKLSVALTIRSYVMNGGFLFAMCSASDSYDIALSAAETDICDQVFDGDGVDVEYQSRLDFSKCLAFENFKIFVNPMIYEYSDIDITPRNGAAARSGAGDYFTLYEFSAKYDPVPTMLTQNHVSVIHGFMGQTTGFVKERIKSSVVILAEKESTNEVKYIHGNSGLGTFTFLGGHDPEDYQHFVGDPPTELSLYRNSPGYRLILNNVLFPAAKKKKQKT